MLATDWRCSFSSSAAARPTRPPPNPRPIKRPLNTAANIPMRPPDRAQQRRNSARTAQSDHGHGASACQEAHLPLRQPFLLTCPSRCKKNGPSRFLKMTQCLCCYEWRDLHRAANRVISTHCTDTRSYSLFLAMGVLWHQATKPCMPQRGGASWSSGPSTSSCLELPHWDVYLFRCRPRQQ